MAAPSSGGDREDSISRLQALQETPIENLQGALTRLIILPIAAFGFGLVDAINAGAGLVINPIDAFSEGLGDIAASILGDLDNEAVTGAADIINAGGVQSAMDIQVFGIGAFPLAIVLAGASAYVLARVGEEDETGNLIPFLPVDIPIIGREEEED